MNAEQRPPEPPDTRAFSQSAPTPPSESGAPVVRVEAVRLSTAGAAPVREQCDVAIEDLLTIMVADVGSFAIMCTPCDVEALTVGFVFSEGLIASRAEVVECAYRPDQHAVGLRLEDPAQVTAGRNLIVTSSCGLCGSRNIHRLKAGQLTVPDKLRVAARVLRTAAQEMHARQRLFTRTGGTHAAGIFDAAGKLLAFGEDVGRHNALDKAVGKCLLQALPLESQGAVLSGRVSLELVTKAARAGLEIVAGVSAPSSLAIDVAQRCNITLCGFVRGERATVYTQPHRVIAPGG
jgi:FdhD protein